jgi:Protein of unknown function (DUF3800)
MNKILFLDESGDHNLTVIDPQHPIFVLGGIIADRDYALGEMTDKLNAFKMELFGTTEIILHTSDYTRQRNGFEAMKDKNFCDEFYKKLNELLAGLRITVVACAILKQQHMAKYGLEAVDPYHLSLNILAERFCFDIGDNAPKGKIIAEARDATLNNQLEIAWLSVKISGTRFMQAVDINNRIDSLILKTKQDKIAGLEIADAIVTPIARRVLRRSSKIDLDIIKSKMRKNHLGEVMGYGLVLLPKNLRLTPATQ